MIPNKLQVGDEVRIIAPARSLAIITPENRLLAQNRIESLGLKVTYAAHVEECDEFKSLSVGSRLDDLHVAFSNPDIKEF